MWLFRSEGSRQEPAWPAGRCGREDGYVQVVYFVRRCLFLLPINIMVPFKSALSMGFSATLQCVCTHVSYVWRACVRACVRVRAQALCRVPVTFLRSFFLWFLGITFIFYCCPLYSAGATVGDLPQPDTLPDHCFELHHSRRRCYFIAPDSAEDKIEWVKMFQLCAWKCKGEDGTRVC